MDNKELLQLHAIVQGHVQGVGFRYFVLESAQSLGLNGWVRNRWDGSVEVIVEGKRDILEMLVKALYEGPRSSRVSNVQVEWRDELEGFSTFYVRTTSF